MCNHQNTTYLKLTAGHEWESERPQVNWSQSSGTLLPSRHTLQSLAFTLTVSGGKPRMVKLKLQFCSCSALGTMPTRKTSNVEPRVSLMGRCQGVVFGCTSARLARSGGRQNRLRTRRGKSSHHDGGRLRARTCAVMIRHRSDMGSQSPPLVFSVSPIILEATTEAWDEAAPVIALDGLDLEVQSDETEHERL